VRQVLLLITFLMDSSSTMHVRLVVRPYVGRALVINCKQRAWKRLIIMNYNYYRANAVFNNICIITCIYLGVPIRDRPILIIAFCFSLIRRVLTQLLFSGNWIYSIFSCLCWCLLSSVKFDFLKMATNKRKVWKFFEFMMFIMTLKTANNYRFRPITIVHTS